MSANIDNASDMPVNRGGMMHMGGGARQERPLIKAFLRQVVRIIADFALEEPSVVGCEMPLHIQRAPLSEHIPLLLAGQINECALNPPIPVPVEKRVATEAWGASERLTIDTTACSCCRAKLRGDGAVVALRELTCGRESHPPVAKCGRHEGSDSGH